jgi:2-polyprenyl-3-methyl-5-hydroxy-6-metoxy-1,4-benzoquinol methylase
LDEVSEKSVYQQHQNDVNDKAYQKFVSPITNRVIDDLSTTSKGLDFGAGTGPVLAKVLNDNGFEMDIYDPYFHNHPKLLEKRYDFIASCEVIEHFYNPYKEFKLFKKLLNPHAKIYLMTEIYTQEIDFTSWYYKNDPTHVFFYTKKTFEWIKNEFDFNSVVVDERLIVFEN